MFLRNKLAEITSRVQQEQLDGVLVKLCATSYDSYLVFFWKPGLGTQTSVEDYIQSPD